MKQELARAPNGGIRLKLAVGQIRPELPVGLERGQHGYQSEKT